MKFYILILMTVMTVSSFSQDFSNYESIPLHTAADYRRAEPQVALAADLVLSLPIDKNNLNRQNALSFTIKWMQGTSDYAFVIEPSLVKITNNDNDLGGVYFACLSKYALAKGKGVDREELRINSFKMFATYCENPDNNYIPKGEMKKMIEAKNKGTLKEYLDSKKK